jgi:Uma2 family endonuclease
MAVKVAATRRRFSRARRLLGRAFVWMQSPLVLAEDTEPQPDIVVLRRRPVPYKGREAGAEDALLVVEVADSPLACDRSTKRRLYAAAGIPEYWIVDTAEIFA